MNTETRGKYHILDTLGKGGFATVFLAKDPDLDRNVALKVMDPLLMRDPVWVKHFRQEARGIARLLQLEIKGNKRK
jgi:serine/threonine protein kinase